MKIVEIENLTYSYDGKKNVLKNVSFSIESGKYISVIGHNGSGKSTLARLLIGLLRPKGGSIKAFGMEYTKENILKIRSRIGIVFQNPDNQFIGSTVQDDIAFGLENRCIPQDRMQGIIDEVSSMVDMKEFLTKEPETLSGGQKQRVAIAGVLALSPDLIIFDEATAMLDPKGKREINETIAKMRKNNPELTLISITHDIEEAFNSDEIVVLSKGEVFDIGTPAELLNKAQELTSIGLDQPFLYKLKQSLKNKGIDVSNASNIEELVNKLC